MLIADLKGMAAGLGIAGAGSMKKAQLVEAIKAAQSGSAQSGSTQSGSKQAGQRQSGSKQDGPKQDGPKQDGPKQDGPKQDGPKQDGPKQDGPKQDGPKQDGGQSDQGADKQAKGAGRQGAQKQNRGDQQGQQKQQNRGDQQGQGRGGRGDQQGQQKQQNRGDQQGQGRGGQGDQGGQQGQGRGGQGDQQGQGEDEESRRNRRRRGRDRQRPAGSRSEPDTQILEDDILLPAAGILDVLDNYAFVRTSGYLPGTEDVYLSLSMVRKFGLRRGDAIVGQVRQPREGERKEKFNPMVRIDSVNGMDPEVAKDRPEFAKFTPLHASERLRLETDPANLIGRVIDIAAPIGKGQRGLIVSPPKAGKTMVLQSIANSISANNPECHLMIVLVDERPEEVTDFQRTVKGEVIASTFDRPATDHTMVAELAIERAKRLVELGHDVVVLLDSITRLGRAYNLAAPASGRILSGGVDSSALYPPKKFFGAARNIEHGGSLTILATALIETGSKMDEVIFEEFKGTGNMELRLRREFADKRIFPAIDAVQSGTRREELLLSREETAIVWKLRRVLSGLEGQQALELLLERLKKSQSNVEFLMQVQKSTPTVGGDD
ncbi:transcription termination factor Rho [Nocardioides limicola]|uniref:transcription termination factor Rho n=1 Tax=Nocardioides limicola TaxID=2803368 RepID=UPI001EF0A12A|nr:transcription termination factor Rho [Nocardioides sp. DJM-14]